MHGGVDSHLYYLSPGSGKRMRERERERFSGYFLELERFFVEEPFWLQDRKRERGGEMRGLEEKEDGVTAVDCQIMMMH